MININLIEYLFFIGCSKAPPILLKMIVIHGLTFLSIAAVVASSQEVDVPANEMLVEQADIILPTREESLTDAPSNEMLDEQAGILPTTRKESFYEIITERRYRRRGRRHRRRRNRKNLNTY